jgi:hypothetical protein
MDLIINSLIVSQIAVLIVVVLFVMWKIKTGKRYERQRTTKHRFRN